MKIIAFSDFQIIISQTTERFDIIHTYINKIFFYLFFWFTISVHSSKPDSFQSVISLVSV